MVRAGAFSAVGLLALTATSNAAEEHGASQRQPYYKKWRNNPKMVVFGDSLSDSGRRFNAPASFDFEDIGPFPWKKLFVANDSEETFKAYIPSAGAATNGKAWPDWLLVPEELNFATSSGSASGTFRSRETCTGYTGEGEDFPTATFDEQVTRYFHDFDYQLDETLDFTHVVFLGGNDVSRALQAAARYNLGGDSYEDPVPFDKVFEIVDEVPQFTFEPVITEIVTALAAGVSRLIEAGVTGRILIANIGAYRGLPTAVASGQAEILDQVAFAIDQAITPMIEANTQLRKVDSFALLGAITDSPEIFEAQGFYEPEDGLPFGTSCLQYKFSIDGMAEIMGTQAGRSPDCQETCALCEDGVSPCQNCLKGNPSATVCDDPDTRLFWDPLHPTTAFHQVFAEAIRQCAKDQPDYDTAWVEVLCPNAS